MKEEINFKEMAAQLRKPNGEDAIKTGEMMSKGNLHMIHETLKVLDAKANDNILEIGMGNGFYVNEIFGKSDSINYTGCDYSEFMVQESEKLNSTWIAKGKATFIQSNITSLPFESNIFNKIFTVNTLYFWDNEIDALSEIKRVIRQDGKFIIAFRPIHQTEKYPFTKYGFNQFSKKDVEELLLANGFSIIDIFENKEPPFEMNGLIMETENIVVVAQKA